MTYRRRTFIPMAYQGLHLGHLQWNGDAMEAWTAEGELVGRYPTRHEAASALWAATTFIRWTMQRSRNKDDNTRRAPA